LNYVNGKSLKPEYEAPKINSYPRPSQTSATEPISSSIKANCHCGRVTFVAPPLTVHEVNSCNCSICTRNGFLGVYPERKDVIFHTGYDHLSTYRFGKKRVSHKFCPSCGSSILVDFNGAGPFGLELGINVSIASSEIHALTTGNRFVCSRISIWKS
jgi:hypothetical protein